MFRLCLLNMKYNLCFVVTVFYNLITVTVLLFFFSLKSLQFVIEIDDVRKLLFINIFSYYSHMVMDITVYILFIVMLQYNWM